MLTSAAPLHHYLYVSRLAPEADSDAVTRILDVSRRRNRELGITGVLVFDGEYFAQLLEGVADTVRALVARIAADVRHTGFTTLHDAPIPGLPQRLCTFWGAGFAQPEQLRPLQGLSGEVAVATFLSLITHFDLSS